MYPKKDYSKVKQTKEEHSAGGVIFRTQNGQIEILVMKDKNSEWTFPKGWIEEGEDLISAAKREIAEEVGITDALFKGKIETVTYYYNFEHTNIHKTVDFFLFEYTGTEMPKPQLEEGITEVTWMPLEKTFTEIGYRKTNLPVLTKAKELIATS